MEKLESLATKRARERNYNRNNDFYCNFATSEVKGFEIEEGVHRRDPSSVILVGDTYYVWYTKSYGKSVGFGTGDLNAKVFPWDLAEIWYATSKDGYEWEEKGLAVARGEKGSFDDRSVLTPEILPYGGKYYLVYQVVQHPYLVRVREHIAMAIADSPDGPFVKLDAPIVKTADNGVWLGEEDDRYKVAEKGDFDSHKVHDPCLFYFNNKFYLYYKGCPIGEQLTMGGRGTKWGVAIAEKPEGPYIKSPYNPITNSGHETCLWQYKGGMVALLTTDGMERNTVQYAKDGINFEIVGTTKGTPEALGPYRSGDNDAYPLAGISWGLCHKLGPWGHIVRFEQLEVRS